MSAHPVVPRQTDAPVRQDFAIWLKPDGAEPPGQPGQQLAARLESVRKIHPLPAELAGVPDPIAEASLADKILGAADSQAVIRLAHLLTSRELDLVFPLLASIGPARHSTLLADRLNLVVRERACPTLYACGWLTFQKYYPCPPAARALTVLCRILEIKQSTEPEQSSGWVRPPVRQWARISHLAMPDSRNLTRRLIRKAAEQGLSLEQLMRQYVIRDDMPFGTELITQSFLCGDARFFRGGHLLFGKALQHAESPDQASLLNHFFSLRDLPQGLYNRYCQEIYRQIGDPADDQPVWDLVRPKYCDAFQEWILAATIGTHCRQQPEKAHLYLRHIQSVRQVEHWDEATLLIHFPGFIVADCRNSPLLAICYDQKDPASGHPFELATGEFNPNPANPAIPHRQVEDAIRRADLTGVVGLPFDPEGIRLTGIFLEMNLKGRRRAWHGKLPQNP